MRAFCALLFRLVIVSVIALAVVSPASAKKDPSPEAERARLIALPPSPGAIARLAAFHEDASVQSAFLRALTDPVPATRAAAARVIHVARIESALDALRGALASERDPEPLREIVMALASMSPIGDVPPLIERAQREGAPLARRLAEVLARRGPEALPLYFDRMKELPLTATERRLFLAVATGYGREPLAAPLEAAIEYGDAAAYAAILAVARHAAAPLPRAALIETLRSGPCDLAARTAWHLALGLTQRGATPAPDLLAAIGARQSGGGCPGLPHDDRLTVELLRRAAGGAAQQDDAWIRWVDSLTTEAGMLDRLLPPAERSASHFDDMPAGWTLIPKPAAWTLFGLPKGMAEDVLAVFGCRPGSSTILSVAELRPAPPPGLPAVAWLARRPSKACALAAETLIALTLPPGDHDPAPGQIATLFVSMDWMVATRASSPWRACDTAEDVTILSVPSSGNPRRTVYRTPEIPDRMRNNYVGGWTAVEAMIGADGALAWVRAARGRDDFMASTIHAILQWRYDLSELPDPTSGYLVTIIVDFGFK